MPCDLGTVSRCLLLMLACLAGLRPQRAGGQEAPPTDTHRMNVLFVAVDDLACAIGCYGDRRAVTPHLDQLAEDGVLFTRAYCQLPLCNPSRASVLTGMRPDQLQVYDLERHFRQSMPQVTTLPQLFRRHGWFTARVGKIFHYDVPFGIGTDGLDDPQSWDVVVNPKGRDTAEEHLIFNAEPHRPISGALSWLAADGDDSEQTDGMVVTAALQLLREHGDAPFFLGVGFFRPHTPYVAPRRYFDLFSFEAMRLPWSPPHDREDIPAAAFAHNCQVPHYGLDERTCREALRAYYASVAFVDAQLGRLRKGLVEAGIANRTIIVLWSDHGYHLGEHQGVWQKRCLFEPSARTPLIIYDPRAAGNGTPCPRIVELVDLYPTIAKSCGLTPPTEVAGRSLVPLLQSPTQPWREVAVTQVLRPGDGMPVMGRSVRTPRWRYTEWNGGQMGRELYDHLHDPHEFHNLAGRADKQSLMERLRSRFDGRAIATPPPTPFNPQRL
ncbi:MAG: iduronate-2-sulfatase [Pirellulaceae bacterium]|nr:MAG: iduronate-2-sulfatase [Pirellulaceae bacterium]